MFFGALLGGVWALIFQPEMVTQIAGEEGWIASLKVVWLALSDGTTVSTSANLNSLLWWRHGFYAQYRLAILSAMTFGAIMEKIGLLERFIRGMLSQ